MNETDMDHGTNEQATRSNSTGLTDDIRGVMGDIERRLDRLRAAHADREREREELEARSAAGEEQAGALEAARKDLEHHQRAHAEAVAAAEARFAELDAREAKARSAFEEAKGHHDALRQELTQRREEMDRSEEDLAEQQAAFGAERARVDELAAEAAQQVKDVEEDRATLEATARELNERQRDLDDQASTLADRVREIDERGKALDARAEQLNEQDRKLAELSRQAAERQEKLSGDSSDLQQQKQWLAEQTKQTDLLRSRVKQLESELEHARAGAAESRTHAENAGVDEAIERELAQTRQKLRDAAGIIAELREQVDTARGATTAEPADVDIAHMQRRQRRLRFVRQTLQQEHGKIAKASELLRQRSAALAQHPGHAHLAHSAAPQPEPSKPAGPLASIARLGIGMVCVAAAIAVLAGVSWIAAGELVNPTYAASVTVAYDARGRDVLAQDRAGWQAFHESLMKDPRFYEFAAERMRQRGLLELGDAVSVKTFVESSVGWASGRDGELMLEVREHGADRARRVAETLAIALVGQANSARERRPDGLPSVISREATADRRPMTNERPLYAGGIFLGLTLASAGMGSVLSRRIAKVREQAAAEAHTAMDDMGEQQEGRIHI